MVGPATACHTGGVEDRLRDLLREFPLEPCWERPTLVRESTCVGAVHVELVGLHARGRDGRSLTASAAGNDASVIDRAYFELLERSATLRAAGLGSGETVVLRDLAGEARGRLAADRLFPPEEDGPLRRHSLSNGVAAHREWGDACRGAAFEAIERDRILRSWFLGGRPPERIGAVPDALRELESHDVRVHRFPDLDDACPAVEVCGVFLFPRDPAEPFCWGSGAGHTLAEARGKAEAEALLRLGFLRGEAVPDAPPPAAPTPDFHLDFFLHPPHQGRIRRWLARGMPPAAGRPAPPPTTKEPRFADLTPPALAGRAAVARALDPARMPLVFGEGHPWVPRPAPGALVHPIA